MKNKMLTKILASDGFADFIGTIVFSAGLRVFRYWKTTQAKKKRSRLAKKEALTAVAESKT